MRITGQNPDQEAPGAVEIGEAPEIGMWGPLYFALWLTGMALAALVNIPRFSSGWMLLTVMLGWAGGLGLTAALACNQRLPMQDLLAGLLPRERLLLALLIAAFFFSPAITDHFYVFIDGWLWTAPLFMLIAVTPLTTRAFLGFMLAGAWMAAMKSGREPWELALVLAFGVSWLIAIGATHFAYTGDPHGLAGWWPIWRLAVSVTQAALPATVAAVGIWLVWPITGLHEPFRGIRAIELIGPQTAHRGIKVPPADMAVLVWQMFIVLILIVWTIWVMLYLRRLFGKRSSSAIAVDLMPEQTAHMEYRAAPPRKAPPKLGGVRGQIVALWRVWSEAMRAENEIRRDGETAREFTGRVEGELPAAAPAPEMNALLEKAHYSPDEPRPEDLDRMRRLVETELSKQSLRRQTPME
ncbi:DUF4129 domain-containing protein [bacterium]|nr:DUF4129 domain-containing protein [bacterium]